MQQWLRLKTTTDGSTILNGLNHSESDFQKVPDMYVGPNRAQLISSLPLWLDAIANAKTQQLQNKIVWKNKQPLTITTGSYKYCKTVFVSNLGPLKNILKPCNGNIQSAGNKTSRFDNKFLWNQNLLSYGEKSQVLDWRLRNQMHILYLSQKIVLQPELSKGFSHSTARPTINEIASNLDTCGEHIFLISVANISFWYLWRTYLLDICGEHISLIRCKII